MASVRAKFICCSYRDKENTTWKEKIFDFALKDSWRQDDTKNVWMETPHQTKRKTKQNKTKKRKEKKTNKQTNKQTKKQKTVNNPPTHPHTHTRALTDIHTRTHKITLSKNQNKFKKINKISPITTAGETCVLSPLLKTISSIIL